MTQCAHRYGITGLALLLSLGWLASANATVTCSVAMSSVNFANVDPLSSQTDVTASLHYTCTTNRVREGVNLCVSLGEPGGDSIYPRKMRDSNNNPLDFQLYTNASRSVVWGSQFSTGDPFEIKFVVVAGTSSSASVPIYGRVMGGQTSTTPGSYSRNYAAGFDTRFTVNAILGTSPPSNCGPGNNNFNFGSFIVSANVVNKCSISTSPLAFGTHPGLLNNAVHASAVLGVECSNTTPYNVGLDAGQNGAGNINARKMVLGPGSVGYQLYRDATRTLVWGNTVGSNTVAGTGSGNTQNLTVYGTVPAQATPPAGTYNDTVVVTVTY